MFCTTVVNIEDRSAFLKTLFKSIFPELDGRQGIAGIVRAAKLMQRNGAFFFTEVVLVRCFQGFLHDLERPVGGDAKNGFPLINRHLLQRAIEKDHGIETDDVDCSVYGAGLETGSLNWAVLVTSTG